MGDNNEGRITLNIYNKPPQFEDDNNENNNENMNQTDSNLIASTDTIPEDNNNYNNNTVNNINTINPTMNYNSPSAPRPTTSSLPTESQVMGIHNNNNNNKSNYKSKISKMNNNDQIYSKPKTNTTLKYPELSAVKQPNNIQNIYQQTPLMINPMPYRPVYYPQYIQTPMIVQPMPYTQPKTVIIREQVKEGNKNEAAKGCCAGFLAGCGALLACCCLMSLLGGGRRRRW